MNNPQNSVDAASANLQLSIRGLIQVAVSLARVLEKDVGREQSPIDPSRVAGVDADMERLQAAAAALNIGRDHQDDRARSASVSSSASRARTLIPQRMPRENARVRRPAPVPVLQDHCDTRHYAVFVGKGVGVVKEWYVVVVRTSKGLLIGLLQEQGVRLDQRCPRCQPTTIQNSRWRRRGVPECVG